MLKYNLLQNYILTAIRNIRKNQLFSIINVFGLALSMSVGLLIITMVNELKGYDDFHENSDRIYRVNNTFQYLDEDPSLFASTSVLAGKRIESEVAGIAGAAIMDRNFSNDFGSEKKKIPLSGYFASADFLKIFTFPVLEGDKETALVEPFSIAITQKAADKLFGRTSNVVGEVLLTSDEKQYTVTALIENPPFNSHLQFEILGSFVTKEELTEDKDRLLSWTNMWMYHVYVLLEDGVDASNINSALAQISSEENAKIEHRSINMKLQPLQAITPGISMSNEIGKTTSREIPIVLSVFALIVIASSCFNYTNLSVARSIKRSKEIGVRKVVGSSSSQVFFQFLVEAIIVALLALFISIALFYFLRSPFLALNEMLAEQLTLDLTPFILLQFVILAAITGIFAGLLPALLFSKISPSAVFRNGVSIGGSRSIILRKVLIITQFALSIGFIFAALIEYRQFNFAMDFDLGYNTNNVLNIELQGNKSDRLKAELSKIPEIEMISSSLMVTSIGNYWAETVKYKDPNDSASVYFNGIDANYIPLHRHQLIAGDNFIPVSNDSATVQVIVNEKLLERFNIGEPEKAIGEMLEYGDKEARIVGVIRDFHFGTIDTKVDPFLFRYETEDFYIMNIKFNEKANLLNAREKIVNVWQEVDEIHPIEARFYSDQIESQYEEYAVMVKVIGALAFLAIVIATMGLLGMVMYTAEMRLKEIGIRKVLGASEHSLRYLLGRGFVILLLIASIIAVPATILLYNNILLADLAYHVDIGILDSITGPLLILLLGLLTIGIITTQAARTNPANILRNE
jgi:putative ABC transport system permease protein